jgi:hypothetical protein
LELFWVGEGENVKARLTSTDTVKLPRYFLLTLVLSYLLLGFFGRDPWKYDDAIGFGVVQSILENGGDLWFFPQIAGVSLDNFPILPFWLNAGINQLLIKLPFSEYVLSTLGSLVWGGLFFFFLWNAAYEWSIHLDAQPEKLPFGGQPKPNEFATTLADGAVLLAVSTVGLSTKLHEISAFAAQMCFVTLCFWGVAQLLNAKKSAVFLVSIGLFGLYFSLSKVAAFTVFGAMLAIAMLSPKYRQDSQGKGTLGRLLIIAFIFLLWSTLDAVFSGVFPSTNRQVLLISSDSFWVFAKSILSNFSWAFWPTWFLSGVFLIFCIKKSNYLQRMLLLMLSILLLVAVVEKTAEAMLFLSVPPLIILTSSAFVFIRRSIISMLDSFAFVLFGFLILFLWLGWAAMFFGVPESLARSAARLVPGFVMPFQWVSFIVSVVLTLFWLGVIIWRLRWHPRVLWRGVVLSAAGMTACWGILNSLWMPSLNYSKSYRELTLSASKVFYKHAQFGDRDVCVATEQLDLPQRAMFAYMADLPLALSVQQSSHCRFLLIQDHVINRHDDTLPKRPESGRWIKMWESRRPTESEWRYRLYRWQSKTTL